MLTKLSMRRARSALRARQAGVVLMMALIVLVAMTLAGIALVRSVDTTNVIAGNLAFQQAATHAGDAGTEAAVTWLTTNNIGNTLDGNIFGQGYAAKRDDPPAGQSWDAYWTGVLVPAGQVVTMPQDGAGNTVSYTIQRLCNQAIAQNAVGAGCEFVVGIGGAAASSRTAGTVALQTNNQVCYRITTRVAGPRNTVSYVQTIISM